MGNGDSKQTAACIGAGICLAYQAYKTLKDGEKAPDAISEDASGTAPIHTGCQSHMIILALDYKGTGNALTCTIDGKNMKALANACGISDVVVLFDSEANKDNVLNAIQEVGSRCQEGDYFIFNYSGHGTSVPDKDGDEDDGKDEALCLVTPEGKIDWNGFLTDDDFAEAVCGAVADGVNILIMCDCCHSGTIGDFDSEEWEGKKAMSMSGCADDQTSGDTGRGGIWTHALLIAIEQMQKDGNDDYSVGQLYNMQMEKDNNVFDSQQDIQLKWTNSLQGPEDMAWPMIPAGQYRAPWKGSHG